MRSSLAIVGLVLVSVIASPVSAQNTSPAEQEGIKATCSWKMSAYGPAEYYRCVDEKTQALQQTRRPDLSGLNSSDLEGIKSACS